MSLMRCSRQTSSSALQNTHNIDVRKNNLPAIILAIGIILMLGGVFLTLAYYQILPHAINSISNLGALGAIIGWGTVLLGAAILIAGMFKKFCKAAPNPPQSLQEKLANIFAVMPEVKEGMRYPMLIACKPYQRRAHIQRMNEAAFCDFLRYLFDAEGGKDFVEVNNSILADLRAYPNWENIARSYDVPEAWIKDIKNAKSSTKDTSSELIE